MVKEQDNTVSMLINGNRYHGWLSVEISTVLMNLAREFTLSVTRNNVDGKVNIPFQSGDEVQVMVGSDKLITGYVDKVEVGYDSDKIDITVSGKSKTVDLMECNIPLGKPHAWRNVPVTQILGDLAAYYGIKVVDKVGLKDKSTLEVAPNEKIGDSIIKLLKKHSLLITDDADGNLVIFSVEKAEQSTDALVLGQNIWKGKRVVDVSNVFSDYAFLGQAKNADSTQSVKANQMKSAAHNEGSRTRWSVQTASGAARQDLLNKRAMLTRNYTVGNADTYTYTVQGWRQSDGKLWTVGTKVVIQDGFVTFPDESSKNEKSGVKNVRKLISKVVYRISSSGTTSEIECKSEDAFLVTEIEDVTKAGAVKQSKRTAGAKKKAKSNKSGGETGGGLVGIKKGSGRTNTTGNWT